MSYNIHNKINNKINFIETSGADIVLLQEYGYKGKFISIQNYPYKSNFPILSIYSKYPILKEGKIITNINDGYSQFADIHINGKIVRFINIYLEPFFIEKQEVEFSNNIEKIEQKFSDIINKLVTTFKIHQNQVNKIKEFILESPYPVILAGDFNAVPNSYEYYQLCENLQDAFLVAGNGLGTSFHDYKLPIRIDYIFSSEEIKPFSYNIDRSIKLSDHYPIFAEFLFP